MNVTKCDICHKTIKGKTVLRVSLDFFESFELCPNCAKPVVTFLKAKKLIRKEKTNKI
jgi:hypothetical protein